jgi:hypothetical protein
MKPIVSSLPSLAKVNLRIEPERFSGSLSKFERPVFQRL